MEFADPTTKAIVDFLRAIGLGVRAGAVADGTALPGIDVDRGTLVVDERKLAWPGDLLHEAGHLAVMTPQDRTASHHDVGDDIGLEIGAIAWSYAAALHLKIDPAVVFHDGGYKGWSQSILRNFAIGKTMGVPILSWCGMTNEERVAERDGLVPYPHMSKWLRED